MQYQRITFNLATANSRQETLDGKPYRVVPTVSITEGVWLGNQGPLLYEPEELGKHPQTWNMKPALAYHPTVNGSGCTKEVIESQGVGHLMNSNYDGRLKHEVWVDEQKADRVDPRIMDAIRKGEPLEVSTGLFHEPEMTPGVWNGKPYVGIVRNIQPDHLAILPDQKGACSIADGAGLLRNAAGTSELSHDDIRDQIRSALKGAGHKYCYIRDVYKDYAVFESDIADDQCCYRVGYKIKAGKVSISGEPEKVRKVTSYVTTNRQGRKEILLNEELQGPLKAPSFHQLDDVHKKNQMQGALKEKYSGVQQEGDWGGWVTDIFANYVVYSKDGKLFRLPYTYDDDKINFGADPEEVERVTEYRSKPAPFSDGTQSPPTINRSTNVPQNQVPATNAMHQGAHQLLHDATQHHDAHHAPGGASDSQVRTTVAGARKAQVDTLIAKHGWGEEQRKMLMDLPDDHFSAINSYSTKGAAQPVTPYTYQGIGDRSSVHGAAHNQSQPTQNQVQRPMTDEEYIATLPTRIQSIVRNSLVQEEGRRADLIGLICNRNPRFNPKWLATRDTMELEGMVSLIGQGQQDEAPRGVHNYAGQGELAMFAANAGGQQINNAEPPSLPLRGVFDSIGTKAG
jgi:hypothetical protein